MNTKRRRAFTLIEMLIVIAIIAILAALIFPSFSAARESARQTSCSSNLREIGLAVQMYRTEEREYPMSLGVLLPPGKTTPTVAAPNLNNNDDLTKPPVVAAPAPQNIDGSNTDGACDTTLKTCPNIGGTGYLRDTKYLLCPDDRSSSTQPRSSYGDLSTGIPDLAAGTPTGSNEDLSRRTWNFWGYRNDNDGVTYNNKAAAQAANGGTTMPVAPATNVLLVDASRKYVAPDTDSTGLTDPNDYRTNVVKNSLSNRFAPPNTIITYCPYHRVFSSKVSDNYKLYDATEAANIAGARDLILRLDGTVKSVVVSSWKADGMWQQQNFR